MRFVCLGLFVGLMALSAYADGHKQSERGSQRGERFAAADADGDGVISKSEFMALAEKRFDKMDTDGNGALSKAEMRPRKRRSSGYGQR